GLTLDIGHAIGAQLNTGEPVVVPDDDWAGWDAVKSVHLSGQQVLTTGRGRVWMDAHGSEFSVQQLHYAAQVLQRGRAVRALTLEMEGASREVVRRNFAHVRALMQEVDICAS
ncbi:MAG TPA: hypothetical protein VFW21_01795, partial [Mycobacterium sp.]|nr:hypothetical protein [Mycobacterium sp.]